MIEITELEVFNLKGAIRGMRQPYKLTDKSDSDFGVVVDSEYCDYHNSFIMGILPEESHNDDEKHEELAEFYYENGTSEYGEHALIYNHIGPKDLNLAQRLIKAGSPHDKFMRQIFVSMDINAPLYW